MNYNGLAVSLALAFASAMSLAGAEGYVETISRERFSGAINFAGSVLQVADTNALATNEFQIAQLKSMSLLPSTTNAPLQRGVLLVNGTQLAGKVETADDTVLRFQKSLKLPPISMHRVASILLRPVPEPWPATSRRGVLLRNNDFVDGEFKAIKDGRVRIESVLFGARTFEASEVAAIVLREPEPQECRFELRTRNNSLWRLTDVTLAKNELVLSEPIVGSWRLRASELLVLQRMATQ